MMQPALHTLAGRSFLFVPGSRPERFGKAASSGADHVVIDLEDAVETAAKREARTAAASFVSSRPALVRINAVGTPEHEEDVDALRHCAELEGVVVPKAEQPAELAALHRGLEAPVVALVETARGLLAAAELAQVRGVARLALGNLDLRLDLGLLTDPDPTEADLAHPRSTLVLASAAAGIHGPVDGVCPDVYEVDALERSAQRALGLGMAGKLCLHPGQVPVVNQSFEPPAPLVAWARAVRELERDTGGAVTLLGGDMLDRPQYARARQILRRAGVE